MTRINLHITTVVLASLLLGACSSDINETATQASSEEATSATTCPSAEDAEDVILYFTGPVAARAATDDYAFVLTFTNALSEVVTIVEEDADARPCIGFDELFAMVELWSDVTVQMTETDDLALSSDEELQNIADLGNEWLRAVDRDELHFSLEADPANIGN